MRMGMLLVGLLVVATGCARFAANRVGDALAEGGRSYAADDDPELIRAAAPFSLKLMESLLEENPQHAGLLLAASRGFAQYAYAFLQMDADRVEATSLDEATALRERARKLYFRSRDYALRGLDGRHPAFSAALRQEPREAVKLATRDDVALLYWAAVAWGGAIGLSKDKPDVVADVPIVAALIERAAFLDPDFEGGAIDTYFITFEMARPGQDSATAARRAREAFEHARHRSEGQAAAPYVSYAEQVMVATQNRTEFESLLGQALAVDVNQRPEWRLENLIMQNRARWLLSRTDDLFVEEASE